MTHFSKELTYKEISLKLKEEYNKLKNELVQLKEKKPTNENDVIKLKKELEEIKNKNEEFKNENSKLKVMISGLQKSLIIDFNDYEIQEEKNRNGEKVKDLTFEELNEIFNNLKNEAVSNKNRTESNEQKSENDFEYTKVNKGLLR